MSASGAVRPTAPTASPSGARRARASFAAVALGIWVILLGGTIPTPLYPIYEQEFHFAATTLTVVYASYAVGVLAGLVLIARASDTIGRRPVLLLGVASGIVSSLVFIAATGVPDLLAGRILSGLSVGLVSSTATAALTELEPAANRVRASGLAVTAAIVGLASGPLLAGGLAEYAPVPTTLVYEVDIGLLVAIAVGFLLIPETAPLLGQGARWTPPRWSVPRDVRPVFVLAAIAGFAGFAVVGLFTALTGTILISILSVSNLAVIGAVVFAMFGTAAVAQLLWTPARPGEPMVVGLVALLAGVALDLASLYARSSAIFGLGILATGVGYGLIFLGSLRLLNEHVPPERRGELLGEYFIVVYLGLSVPVVGVGVMADAYGLSVAATIFSVVVAALLVASLGLVRRFTRPRAP
jgi:MFS family permease